MKTTKRILAITLASLLLGFLLLPPAGAVEAAAPSISRQPASFTLMFAGDDLVLEAGAAATSGVLTYTWYREGSDEPVGTGEKLVLPTDASLLTNVIVFHRYYAVVTETTYMDGSADQTEIATTRYATVIFTARLGDALKFMWQGNLMTTLLVSPLLAIASVLYIFIYPAIWVTMLFA